MKMMKSLLALGIVTLGASAAYAATQGTLGATSTGTADITVTISEQYRISSLQDYTFGTYAGTGDLTSNDDVCVYHNGDGLYTVTATGSGAANAFTVTNGSNTIAYGVAFNDQTGVVGQTALTTGNASATQSGANVTSSDCSSGGLSANLEVELLEAALQAAPAGAYTGTVTVVVQTN